MDKIDTVEGMTDRYLSATDGKPVLLSVDFFCLQK